MGPVQNLRYGAGRWRQSYISSEFFFSLIFQYLRFVQPITTVEFTPKPSFLFLSLLTHPFTLRPDTAARRLRAAAALAPASAGAPPPMHAPARPCLRAMSSRHRCPPPTTRARHPTLSRRCRPPRRHPGRRAPPAPGRRASVGHLHCPYPLPSGGSPFNICNVLLQHFQWTESTLWLHYFNILFQHSVSKMLNAFF